MASWQIYIILAGAGVALIYTLANIMMLPPAPRE